MKPNMSELKAYVTELRLKIMYENVVIKANVDINDNINANVNVNANVNTRCSTWAERTLKKRRNPR